MNSAETGYWGHMDAYTISLLKAWWGEPRPPTTTTASTTCRGSTAATPPTSRRSTCSTARSRATSCSARTRRSAPPTRGLHRKALAALDWLVVRDFQEIESAAFWHEGPEIESGELVTAEIGTEVFMMPAASHVEKDGSFTNTQRLLQWHHKAIEPPGDCRSELWFAYHLGRRIRAKLSGSTDPRDRPIHDLTWDYPTEGPHDDPSAEAVLREINGVDIDEDRALDGYTALKNDGSTACGCWIYCGAFAGETQPAGPPQARLRAELGRFGVGMGLADEPADHLQPRLRRPGRQAVVGAQEVRLVGPRAG